MFCSSNSSKLTVHFSTKVAFSHSFPTSDLVQNRWMQTIIVFSKHPLFNSNACSFHVPRASSDFRCGSCVSFMTKLAKLNLGMSLGLAAIFVCSLTGRVWARFRFSFLYIYLAFFSRKMSSKPSRKDSVCLCVVCCEDIEFYAIGVCDHSVCHKCCIRMRVLGKETYCPVCRTELKQVRKTKWVADIKISESLTPRNLSRDSALRPC